MSTLLETMTLQTKKKSDSALALLGVVAFLVGGFSLLGGVAAVAMWVAGDAYYELLASIQSGPAEGAMYAELAAIQERWSVWTVWLGAASVPPGLMLAYGGVRLLGKKTMTLASVQWAFGAVFAVDLLGLYPDVSMQIEVIEASQRFALGFRASMSERMPDAGGTAETIMNLGTNMTMNAQIGGAITGLLLVAGKMACAVGALIFIYRRRSAGVPV